MKRAHTYLNEVELSSLPVWERGLKQVDLKNAASRFESLPVWERGLKQEIESKNKIVDKSLPVWERGLKPYGLLNMVFHLSRSPCGSVD